MAGQSRAESRMEVPSHGKGKLKRGGTNPGAGRPKKEYTDWCRDLLDQADSRGQVEALMKDSHHPAYATMYKELANRAHGKPKESVAMTLTGEVTVKQEWTFGKRKVGF